MARSFANLQPKGVDVFARLRAELHCLCTITLEVEASLCSAADSWAIDDRRLRDLQRLDSVSQHLAALRDFVGALQLPAGATLDVAESLSLVSLEGVRSRLAGEGPEEDVGSPVELF